MMFLGIDVTIKCLLCIYIIGLPVFLMYSITNKKTVVKRLIRSAYENEIKILSDADKTIRDYRHDFKNHIIALKGMLDESDVSSAKEYLNKLTEGLLIKGQFSNSGIYKIDSLINYILSDKKDGVWNISVSVSVPEDLRMDYYDFDVVLGNLLKNSVAGAEKSNEKMINLGIRYDKGIIYISLKNSTSERTISEKTDAVEHGRGLRIVRETLERNKGQLSIEKEDGLYVVNALMYCRCSNTVR